MGGDDSEGLRFTPSLAFVCPFCQGRSAAGSVHGGKFPQGSYAVTHSDPPCEKWKQLEPDEFLKAVRLEYEKKRAQA